MRTLENLVLLINGVTQNEKLTFPYVSALVGCYTIIIYTGKFLLAIICYMHHGNFDLQYALHDLKSYW